MSKETQGRKFIVFFPARSWHSPELEEGHLWASEAGPRSWGWGLCGYLKSMDPPSNSIFLPKVCCCISSFSILVFLSWSPIGRVDIVKKQKTMEVSRGRIWLSRQPESQAFVLLTADSYTFSAQGRLSLPGLFLQIFQISYLGPGGMGF